MTHFHISFLLTILTLAGAATFRPTTADQLLSCTMCDECDNPCQQPPSPPPPPPSAITNCPPPPSPPTSGGNMFPYYPPPPPASGGGYGYGYGYGYEYPTPPPPNPILPYFPFYYYTPPSSVSGHLNINRFQILIPLSFVMLLFLLCGDFC